MSSDHEVEHVSGRAVRQWRAELDASELSWPCKCCSDPQPMGPGLYCDYCWSHYPWDWSDLPAGGDTSA